MKLKRSPIYFALCSLLPSLGWAEMLEEIEVSALRDPTEYAQTQNKIERFIRSIISQNIYIEKSGQNFMMHAVNNHV